MLVFYNRLGENILRHKGLEVPGGCRIRYIHSKSGGNYWKMPSQRHVCYFLMNSASHVTWVLTHVHPGLSISLRMPRFTVHRLSIPARPTDRQLNKLFVWPSQRYVTFCTRCYVFFTITMHHFKPHKYVFYSENKIVRIRNTKAYRGGKVRFHPFRTIGGDEWSALHTGRLKPGKECSVPDEQESLAGCFLVDIYFLNGTRSPDRPARNVSVHRILYKLLDFHDTKHMEITTRNLEIFYNSILAVPECCAS